MNYFFFTDCFFNYFPLLLFSQNIFKKKNEMRKEKPTASNQQRKNRYQQPAQQDSQPTTSRQHWKNQHQRPAANQQPATSPATVTTSTTAAPARPAKHTRPSHSRQAGRQHPTPYQQSHTSGTPQPWDSQPTSTTSTSGNHSRSTAATLIIRHQQPLRQSYNDQRSSRSAPNHRTTWQPAAPNRQQQSSPASHTNDQRSNRTTATAPQPKQRPNNSHRGQQAARTTKQRGQQAGNRPPAPRR